MSGIQSFIQVQHESLPAIQEQYDRIVSWAYQQEHALGYFAVLYQHSMRQVQADIEWGKFQQKDLMRQLTILLANRYFEVLSAFFQQKVLPSAWQLTITATTNQQVSVFQHLVIGLMSHLQYDLPRCAGELLTAETLEDFEEDYFTYILMQVELIERVQSNLMRRSKAFRVLNALNNSHDQWLAALSNTEAYRKSWQDVAQLIRTDKETRVELIDRIDSQATAQVEDVVALAFRPQRRLFNRMSRWENQPVSRLIDELKKAIAE
jgi:hypothetical protein